MSWIPGWDSITGADWWSSFYFWAGIIALLALGVAEVVSHRYTDRKDELTTAQQDATQRRHDEEMARLHLATSKADERAAAANERAASLEKESAALRADLTKRLPRTISEEQKTLIVNLLRPDAIHKGTVLMNPVMDGEAWAFSEAISSVLKEAGFDPKEVDFGRRSIAMNRPGAFLWVKDGKNQPRHGGPIWTAFQRAGISFTGEEQPNDVPDNDTVVLAISSHP